MRQRRLVSPGPRDRPRAGDVSSRGARREPRSTHAGVTLRQYRHLGRRWSCRHAARRVDVAHSSGTAVRTGREQSGLRTGSAGYHHSVGRVRGYHHRLRPSAGPRDFARPAGDRTAARKRGSIARNPATAHRTGGGSNGELLRPCDLHGIPVRGPSRRFADQCRAPAAPSDSRDGGSAAVCRIEIFSRGAASRAASARHFTDGLGRAIARQPSGLAVVSDRSAALAPSPGHSGHRRVYGRVTLLHRPTASGPHVRRRRSNLSSRGRERGGGESFVRRGDGRPIHSGSLRISRRNHRSVRRKKRQAARRFIFTMPTAIFRRQSRPHDSARRLSRS